MAGGEEGQTWEVQVNEYTYDDTDRLISTTDPAGVVTTTQLTATSDLVTTTTQIKQGGTVARTTIANRRRTAPTPSRPRAA